MKNIFNSLSVQIIIYLSCLCPPFLSYISYLSLQVRLPALPVSTFVVLHIIPFSTGKFTFLVGVHLFCPTFHTFFKKYVYLPCRCPPFLSYILYLFLQDSQPSSCMFIYLINFQLVINIICMLLIWAQFGNQSTVAVILPQSVECPKICIQVM